MRAGAPLHQFAPAEARQAHRAAGGGSGGHGHLGHGEQGEREGTAAKPDGPAASAEGTPGPMGVGDAGAAAWWQDRAMAMGLVAPQRNKTRGLWHC